MVWDFIVKNDLTIKQWVEAVFETLWVKYIYQGYNEKLSMFFFAWWVTWHDIRTVYNLLVQKTNNQIEKSSLWIKTPDFPDTVKVIKWELDDIKPTDRFLTIDVVPNVDNLTLDEQFFNFLSTNENYKFVITHKTFKDDYFWIENIRLHIVF